MSFLILDITCGKIAGFSFYYARSINQKIITREIRKNGTSSYKGKWYTIDYKLAGKNVELQETNQGKIILVYFDGVLLANS